MNITIDGVTYKAAYPVGATLTHEGGLNQACVQIRHIDKLDPFTPFTDVNFLGEWWCIAHDEVTKERYIGKATHNITLVEITKRLERVICGAKTFTHPLYAESAHFVVEPVYYRQTQHNLVAGKIVNTFERENVERSSLFYIPAQSGEILDGAGYLPLSVRNVYKAPFSPPKAKACATAERSPLLGTYSCGGAIASVSTSLDGPYEEIEGGGNISEAGMLYVKYTCKVFYYDSTGAHAITYIDETIYQTRISTTESGWERKNLTIGEVTDRLLITAETVRSPSERKYLLTHSASGAIDITNIEAPELSFADGATLKENLDQIAKILHAKTRMRKLTDTNQYEVWFVPLTTNVKATMTGTLIGDQTAFSAEKYAGTLHTSAQNLTISKGYEGNIAEPSGEAQGADTDDGKLMRSLRCADSEARISDTTGEIETLLPIKRVVSLKMNYNGTIADITDYVREKAVYQGLSKYGDEQSRAYYLYYTIGEKNIKGCFEKSETSKPTGFEALDRYAIINVFCASTGKNSSIFGETTKYPDVLFYVEYEPYMNIHLVSTRADGRGGEIAYIANQSASEVDKDSLAYFARGTVEQMASDSPRKTYLMSSLDKVPTVGTMYDNQNYISEVSFEVYPYFVKCTITIAEHYNRLGQRVEVANAVRQYEIDVNNVRDRHVLYTDVCNISFAHDENATGSILSDAGKKRAIRHAADSYSVFFTDGTASLARITTFACPQAKNALPNAAQAREIQSVHLPVLSFGFGNSIVFTVPFKDNFSAGSRAAALENKPDALFNMNEYVQYGDGYGAAELMKFSLHNGASILIKDAEKKKEFGRNLPLLPEMTDGIFAGGTLGAKYADTDDGNTPYIYLFKDSREKITFTYQLLFQSDSGIIIGNDLARTSPLVSDYHRAKELQDFERGTEFDPNNTTNSLEIHFYGEGYGDPSGRILHPITGTTVTSDKKSIVTLDEEDGKLWLAPDFVYAHDSWAIIRFGKFMLGSNRPFPADGKLYFNYSHK